jgi:tetratricopeptide (TPR) repeat protein
LLVRTWETSRRVLGDTHPDTLGVQHELGLLYHAQGRHPEAEPLLLQVVEARLGQLGEKHPHTLAALNSLVALYEAWGKSAEAAKWRQRLDRGRPPNTP